MNIEHNVQGRFVVFDVYDSIEKEAPEVIVSSVTTEMIAPPRFVRDYVNKPLNKFIYFGNFFTKPLARKKGYGRKLIKEVKEYYKGYVIYLGVGCFGPGNIMTDEQLVAFYESEGFKVVPQSEDGPYTIMLIEL